MFDSQDELFRISDAEGTLVVSQSHDRRVMTFGTIYDQSAMHLDKPHALVFDYTQAMLIALVFNMPQHVTLLGLGGGSLLRCLHHHFDDMHFCVVELRHHVLAAAKAYFMVPEDERIAYVIDDGVRVIAQSKSRSTDLILSDMYNAMGPERFQESTDFLLEARRVLSSNGWLVINCHDLPPVTSVFMQQALHSFKEVYSVALNSGNYVLFLGKSPLKIPFDELAFSTLALEQRTGERFYSHARRLVKIEDNEKDSSRLVRPSNADESIVFRM